MNPVIPAEQAAIKLDLGQNKIKNLIKLASKNSDDHIKHIFLGQTGMGNTNAIDADKVDDIALKFFKQSYSSVDIMNKTL